MKMTKEQIKESLENWFNNDSLYATDLERNMLMPLLLEQQDALSNLELLKEEYFSDVKVKSLFKIILELYRQKKPIDFLHIREYLVSKNYKHDKIHKVICYALECSNQEYLPRAYRYYVMILATKYLERKAKNKILQYTGTDILEFMKEMEANMREEYQNVVIATNDSPTAIKGLDLDIKLKNERWHQGYYFGLETGFADLDHHTEGVCPNDHITIGAGTGVGKSIFLINLIANIYTTRVDFQYEPYTLFFNLEMTEAEVTARFLSLLSGIPQKQLMRGDLNDYEKGKVEEAKIKLAKMNISFANLQRFTLNNIILLINKFKNLINHQHSGKIRAKTPFFIIAIDYLQLIHEPSQTKIQQVSNISIRLREISKEANTACIIISQLNRDSQDRNQGKPTIRDLKESGQIENDSTKIMLLWRPEKHNCEEHEGHSTKNMIVCILGKYRSGDGGEFLFHFDKDTLKIRSFSYQKWQETQQISEAKHLEDDAIPF